MVWLVSVLDNISKESLSLETVGRYYRLVVSALFGYSFLLSIAYLKGYWSFFGWSFVDFYSVSEIVKSSILPTSFSFVFLVLYSAIVFSIPRIFKFVIKNKSDDVARFAAVLGMSITILRNQWVGEDTVAILILLLSLSLVFAVIAKSKIRLINGLYIAFFSMLPLLLSYDLGRNKADDVVNNLDYNYLDMSTGDFDIPAEYCPLKYITTIGSRVFLVAVDNKTLVTIHVDGKNFILKKGIDDKKTK